MSQSQKKKILIQIKHSEVGSQSGSWVYNRLKVFISKTSNIGNDKLFLNLSTADYNYSCGEENLSLLQIACWREWMESDFSQQELPQAKEMISKIASSLLFPNDVSSRLMSWLDRMKGLVEVKANATHSRL